MIWKKYSIKVNTKSNVDAVDIVASTLFDNGIVGVEIEDKKNLTIEELSEMFVDIPEIMEDDGKAIVSFFVRVVSDSEKDAIKKSTIKCDDTVDNSYKESNDNIFTSGELDDILNNIKEDLKFYKNVIDIDTPYFTVEDLDSEVFLNNWKKNFVPFDVGDISIIPYIDDIEEINKIKNEEHINGTKRINIFIEPGNAFGTGKHPTTELCMRALEDLRCVVDFDVASMLDVGCGSGILSILAKKLHMKEVVAIDIDENVRLNLNDNLKLNDIADLKIEIGNIIDDEKLRNKYRNRGFDIVIANILAPVIISLLTKGRIDEFIKVGGYMICSGIILERLDEIKDIIFRDNKFKIINETIKDNWACIVLKKI